MPISHVFFCLQNGKPDYNDDQDRKSYQLCKVVLPDNSTTILPCKPGEILSSVIQKLLEKREFTYSAFEVISVSSGKVIYTNQLQVQMKLICNYTFSFSRQWIQIWKLRTSQREKLELNQEPLLRLNCHMDGRLGFVRILSEKWPKFWRTFWLNTL